MAKPFIVAYPGRRYLLFETFGATDVTYPTITSDPHAAAQFGSETEADKAAGDVAESAGRCSQARWANWKIEQLAAVEPQAA